MTPLAVDGGCRSPAVHAGTSADGVDRDLLRAFVQAYWLRPENALWMYLRSITLRDTSLAGPCMDVSCGDGVFMFLHLGGRTDPAFDVFAAVTDLDHVRDEHADMFDCPGGAGRPVITTKPHQRIDVGTDLKLNLLDKARKLCVYERLVPADNNLPLPFPDGSFQTIYCNAAYWVERIELFLPELRRILRSGGRLIVPAKLAAMRDYTLESHRGVLGDRFLEIIGRGRLDCWPTLTDRTTWEQRFATAGFRIAQATPLATRTHAHIWDIGLRPLAPLLIRMAAAISTETRAAIKSDAVDLWCELLGPFARPDLDLFAGRSDPAEIHYVLGG